MAKGTFYTAIDLGTTKVCTIIAKIGPQGDLKVLGTGIVPSQGMQKGRIESLRDTQEAVRASVSEAQRYLGRRTSWTYLGITGDHITCINTMGSMDADIDSGAVSSQDVLHLIQSSYPQVAAGKEVLHVIPIGYGVDGLTGVRNPIGLHAQRIEVESHVVLGEAPILKNMVKAVQGSGLSVRCLVLQSLASAEAILTESEREMGSVMLDMGGGTTDLTVFRTGNPWYTAVIPVGGNQLTRDLSVALGAPFYIAEELKIKWGHALPDAIPGDQEVQLPGFQGLPRRMIKRRAMCLPLHDRLTETFRLVLTRLREAGLRQLPPGGMIITGGVAEMPGLKELAQKVTGAPVRIAHPAGILGLPAELKKPAFSTSVGTLLWGIKHQGERRYYRNGERSLLGHMPLFHRFRRNWQRATA